MLHIYVDFIAYLRTDATPDNRLSFFKASTRRRRTSRRSKIVYGRCFEYVLVRWSFLYTEYILLFITKYYYNILLYNKIQRDVYNPIINLHGLSLLFMLCVVAPSGTGKTNFVSDLIDWFCVGEGTFKPITILT